MEQTLNREVAPGIAVSKNQELLRNIVLMVSASFLIAVCAHISFPLGLVPVSFGNFAVLLVGLVLGSKRGFAAALLYLSEGASGLPVFVPHGPGGIAEILGPTGGYLFAYPLVAFLAGLIFERSRRSFGQALAATAVSQILLFAAGVSWIAILYLHFDYRRAAEAGLYPFLPGEAIKMLFAAAIATRLPDFAARLRKR